MKRTIPHWLFLFLIGTAVFFTYLGFLYIHFSVGDGQLITLQGNPSSLSKLKLSYSEFLSPYGDYLTSNMLLGDKIASERTYHSKVLNNDDDTPIDSQFDYTLPILEVSSFFEREKNTPTLSCKILTQNTSSMEEFPFLTIKTPDDYVTPDEEADESSSFSDYNIAINSSHYVTLEKKHYFFISSVTAQKDDREVPLSYTIQGGLFLHNKNSVEGIYDFTITDSNQQKVIDLFPIDDQDCLGLIIQRKDAYFLQVIDPNAKKAVASYPLPFFANGNSEEEPYGQYSPSSHTLILCSQDTIYCYQLSNPSTLQPLASYNITKMNALQKNKQSSLFSVADHVYFNGTLYIVTNPRLTDDEPLPYLLAFQTDKIVYEGYLSMDTKKDSATTKKHNSQDENIDEDSLDIAEKDFQRSFAQIHLSLAK